MGISQCYLQSSDAKVLMIIQKISEKISSSHPPWYAHYIRIIALLVTMFPHFRKLLSYYAFTYHIPISY